MLFYPEKTFNNYKIDANYFGFTLRTRIRFSKNNSDSKMSFLKT